MVTKDFSQYTDAEKIVLAEELWDSVSKNEITIGNQVRDIMEARLQRIEAGEAAMYSREEMKKRIDERRKSAK